MSASKKRPVPASRARMSAILQQIEDLIGVFDEIRAVDDKAARDAATALYMATLDARQMIGDRLEVGDEWTVAAARPKTRAELNAS